MTTARAVEVERRRPAPPIVRTFEGAMYVLADELLGEIEGIRFPDPRFRDDPVTFCRLILGVEPWAKQIEILDAVRTHKRVAVSSGHKVGKSNAAAVLALWFYCAFPDARVVMSSTTARQVDQILWREVKMLKARGGRCVDCKRKEPDGPTPCEHSALVDGDIGELARTGLKKDFREVVGFTAREAEGVAGVSGKNLLYIVDEASGVDQAIFEAIEGNRAGGARLVLFSNPTRNEGEHFDAFHSKSQFYRSITISSEESPNVVEDRDVIPGLATREWIEEKRVEWGEESPLFLVRVKGKHALTEDGRIFSVHKIAEAEKRWHETPAIGRLFIGLDPAGETGTGDETVFAPRRGLKLLRLCPFTGLNDDAHVVHLLSLIKELRLPGRPRVAPEVPVVVLDREGSIGAKLYGKLQAYVDEHPGSFEVVGVRSSDRAIRKTSLYDRVRDELTANLEDWIRSGGAIPEDTKLAKELHAVQWESQINGRVKVTPKKGLKKLLGRSPDRYDALALSVWEPLSIRESAASSQSAAAAADEPSMPLDPYAAARTWEPR